MRITRAEIVALIADRLGPHDDESCPDHIPAVHPLADTLPTTEPANAEGVAR